jgi:hypothetical protein
MRALESLKQALELVFESANTDNYIHGFWTEGMTLQRLCTPCVASTAKLLVHIFQP